LRAADITDVDQLVTYSADDLIERGVGASELYEIVCHLNERDTSLPSSRGGNIRVPSDRTREMFHLRVVEGLTLKEVGQRYGIIPERVRQIMAAHFGLRGSPPTVKAKRWASTEKRHADNLARAQARAEDIIAAWRDGAGTQHLADKFDLPWACVEEFIGTTATDADRAARTRARYARRRPPGLRPKQ
jgi:Sigma-70, region 4